MPNDNLITMPIPTGTYNNSTKYNFTAHLFQDHNYDPTKGYMLSQQDITLVEIRNTINQLYLTGVLTYTDRVGTMANYVNLPVVNCLISFYEIPQQQDGTFTAESQAVTENSPTAFIQRFVVDKFEVVKRDDNAITYKLALVGENWKKCVATLDYSNFDKDPEPIGKILVDCFSAQKLQLKCDNPEKIFPTKINYCTAGQSNIVKTMDYLLFRTQYDREDTLDTSLKVIWYSTIDDTYRITDLNNLDTYCQNSYSMVMSMFKGTEESLVSFLPGDIATVDDYISNTEQMQTMFDVKFYKHDLSTTNEISSDEISSITLANYYESSAIPDKLNTAELTSKRLLSSVYDMTGQTAEGANDLKFIRRNSYDGNPANLYDDQFQLFMRSNSIRVLTDGAIGRTPTSTMAISIPKDWNDVKTDNADLYREWRSRYMSFEGPYVITEVVSLISPSLQIFRQNLRLSRNFLPVSKLVKY